MKMSFGNRVGFRSEAGLENEWWYVPFYAAIAAELTEDTDCPCARRIGMTTAEPVITICHDSAEIDELLSLNESVLEDVYPTRTAETGNVEPITWTGKAPAVMPHGIASPRTVIPVFPGANCEYDSLRACLRAGMTAETVVIRNLTAEALAQSALELERSIRNAQIVFLPGGFSGGDEPDGSAKFIVSFLRNPRLTDAIHDLLQNRDGLMLGICNGFQALVKLGLIPFGEIRDTDGSCPTLTYNTIGRHQSSIVRTRVCSSLSPWLLETAPGRTWRRIFGSGIPRRGAVHSPGECPAPAGGQRPDRHSVCGSDRRAYHGYSLQPQRGPVGRRGRCLPQRPGAGQDGPQRTYRSLPLPERPRPV